MLSLAKPSRNIDWWCCFLLSQDAKLLELLVDFQKKNPWWPLDHGAIVSVGFRVGGLCWSLKAKEVWSWTSKRNQPGQRQGAGWVISSPPEPQDAMRSTRPKCQAMSNQLGHQVTFTSSSYREFPGCPMTLDSKKKNSDLFNGTILEINFCWQYMTEKTKIYLQPSHVATWILPVNPEICLLGWKASKKMQWRGRILPRLCATDVVVADTRTCLRSHVLRFPANIYVYIYMCIYICVIICKEKTTLHRNPG